MAQQGNEPPAPVRAGTPDHWRRRLRRAVGPVVVAARRIDASARVLPDFVVIGAQKAGTTTLYSQLVAHPSVLAALRKEVHYFDAPPRAVGWYRAFFPRRGKARSVAARTGAVHVGEATPFYLCHPLAPARMQAVIPHVRCIAVLRDPVARAVSGYHHAVRMGFESRPVEVALDPATEAPVGAVDDGAWWDDPHCPVRRHGYLARGRYAEQLERWFAVFPREQVLVVDTAELDSGRARAAALAHLGVRAAGAAVVADRNVARYAPAATDLEERLRAYFAPHNARLWELLGDDWGWPDRPR